MTLKDVILKTLEYLKLADSQNIYNYIVENKHYDFKDAKTPHLTVSAVLTNFISKGDVRVKRTKMNEGNYMYYLSKNEQSIDIDVLPLQQTQVQTDNIKNYKERDLHILLSTYLKNTDIYSKTIFHEDSTFQKERNQIWTHPDMIGVKFMALQAKASQLFIKTIKPFETFKLTSYELKRTITSDSELKKAFFQAVSNSSWANYGYLVALEFNSNLLEEMQRLNEAFGIGVIELSHCPNESKILFQSKYRDLDFKTIDKLCKMNETFAEFIVLIEKLITEEERHYKSTQKELVNFCDTFFTDDTEAKNYCISKHILSEFDVLEEN